jgi:glyoxylase-like metal-dependent hydrolase (beta-lactamase superfamily II)
VAGSVILGPVSPPVAAQMENVVIETTDLGGGIHMLKGRGGNIGVCVGDDGVFAIDDQMAPLTDKILAAISKLSPKPIEFLVNTHYHGDHTGGNENMGKAGVLLIAHENVRERLRTGSGRTPAASPEALPVVVFTDAVTFHWNDEEIHVFHVSKAHTDGDAIIHFKNANVIHMGDTFFNGSYPFIDTDGGGSVKGLLAAIDHALPLSDANTKVIPGHGTLSDREGLRFYRDMLGTIAQRIKAAIEEGKSLEEVKAANPSGDWDEDWGNAFISPEALVETIYQDLSRK